MAINADSPAGELNHDLNADGEPSAITLDTVSEQRDTSFDRTVASDSDGRDSNAREERHRDSLSPQRTAALVSLALVLALAGLVGWMGWRSYETRQAQQQRELFIQVGRQAAINLTTIDFTRADLDVQRILDAATDTFFDDFSERSQPFVDVVKQAQSKSVGEVTSAGLESEAEDQAQVLVAVSVKTSNAGAPEQEPRAWRMRISVKRVGEDEAKVSNVEFVP